jgi:membrane protease YdiL (CAAX protease family)/uncharacterized RDD family membrane protein YckC
VTTLPAWPTVSRAPAGGPAVDLEIASPGRRVAAFLLDAVFMVLIAVAADAVGGVVIEAAVGPGHSVTPASAASPQVLLGTLLVLLGIVATPFLYPALGWRRGGTPGMAILGLRVVDARTGARLTWGQVMLRAAGWWWSVVSLGGGFVPVFVDWRRRGLADRMASSLVLATHPLPMMWVQSGWGWGLSPARPPAAPPVDPGAPLMVEPPPTRASWTWTDVLPVLLTMLPIIFGVNWVAVATARGLGITAGSGGAAALSYADEIAAYGGSLLIVALLVGLRRHTPLLALGLRPPGWRWLAAALPLGFAALVLQDAGGVVSRAIFAGSNTTNQGIALRSEFNGSLALTLVAVAVVAPIAEEVIFRGFAFRWLWGRLPLWAAVVVDAALFSAAHVGWGEPVLFLPIFASGCLLAYLYAKSGSIWPGVLVHATINAVAVMATLRIAGC